MLLEGIAYPHLSVDGVAGAGRSGQMRGNRTSKPGAHPPVRPRRR